MQDRKLDLICIGRSCVDMYSGEFGVPLQRAMTFSKSVGGSPMNIAIGTSRLGLKVGAITGVGKEGNGDYIKWQMTCEGVDVSHVKTDPARLTAMVLLSIRGKDDFPLIQYRENCADMGLQPEDIDEEYIKTAGAVLVTGTHLSKEGVRATTMKVLEIARSNGIKCIFDIDFRPNLWGLRGHDAGASRLAQSEWVSSEYRKVLPYFDLIVGTEEEYFIASGKTDPIEALREVRRLSKAVLIHKLGDRGCAALDGEIPDRFTDDVVQPGFPVKVFNSIGAGDGFMSGFLRGWLRGEDLPTCCRYANAAGAFAVSRLGCSSAYPSWAEMQYFLEHGSKEKWLRKDKMLNQMHWSTNRRVKWNDLAILAFDHRAVLEELAEKHQRGAKDIARFKELVYQGALKVQAESSPMQVGILADDTHGLDVLLDSNKHPLWVGRCIEKTGAPALEFEGLPDVGSTLSSWPENHVVKCLLKVNENSGAAIEAEQKKQLERLFCATRETGHDLLLELIAEGKDRDSLLLRWMEDCYGMGVFPDYWKLQAPEDPQTWHSIAACIEKEDPYCRGVLLLGFNSPAEELRLQFSAIPRDVRMLGFAIGRSIFLEAAEKWFAGSCTDENVAENVAEKFRILITAWNNRYCKERIL
ncbi:MAG: 5-dehydro-2-deoxygluconokinase [Mailhella sp.]|nr:5-dehydro-2-deoxygluconokinase [Mailhella sp.]